MGNFLSNIGNAVTGAAKTAVGIAPYAANMIHQRNESDKRDALLKIAQDRQAKQDALAEALGRANIAHVNAQTTAAQEGSWSNPFAATDDTGNPVMVQQHKQTGELRRATIGGGQSNAAPTAPSAPAAPSASGIDGANVGMADDQDPQAPAQQGAQAPQTPTASIPAKQPGLRPYVKPLPPQKIDPNSPAGIAAAGQKAGAVAAAKAPYAKPSAPPHIDPRSVEGIAADSTRAAKVAQAQQPYKKDPNAAGGGAMSGQTMQTMARMGTSYNDLKQAIDQMDQYENTPGNLAKQTASKQALGAMSEVHPSQDAHGLMGALNNGLGALVGAKAGEKIGQDDPEYRTYLNNKQRVATAFTELLPRPNQALLQLEKGLSGADVSWNPTLIRNIQARRRGGLDVLKNILGSQGMLDGQGNMTGTPAGGGRGRGGAPASTGNIDLHDPQPAKPAAKPAAKKDYGIFTPPGDE